MANNLVIDVYDADLGNVTSGDPIDPTLGLKLKIYDRSAGFEQLATILLAADPETGNPVLTVYRDAPIPLTIRTVDYFDGSVDGLNGSDPGYYTILRP